MIACNFFDEGAIIFIQHKKAEKVKQTGWVQHAPHKGFKLIEGAKRIKRETVNGTPCHKALGIGGE